MDAPFPQTPWGEFWTPPIEDDLPVPSDVELDKDTGRYRHIINRPQYRADIQAWLRAAHE